MTKNLLFVRGLQIKIFHSENKLETLTPKVPENNIDSNVIVTISNVLNSGGYSQTPSVTRKFPVQCTTTHYNISERAGFTMTGAFQVTQSDATVLVMAE